MEKDSKKEKFLFHNNMVCLVKALENHSTVIDLRNENSVYGKIIYVDAFMNVEMENAVLRDSRGNKYPFDMFFIQSRNIRYVQIPKKLNAVKLVEDQLAKMSRIKTTQPKNRKAKAFHEQIVQELKNQPS